MRRLILISVSLFLFCSVSYAQTAIPDEGRIKEGVYANSFFGFNYAYPKDWIVQGEETMARIKELGKERTKETKALPDASTEAVFKRTYQLLTISKYELGAANDNPNAIIQVIAEDIRHAPAIVDGRGYLLNVREFMMKFGLRPLQQEPVAVVFSDRKFFRQDCEQTVNGQSVRLTFLVSVHKGFALAFTFNAVTEKEVDEMIKTMESLKFSATESTKIAALASPTVSNRRLIPGL